MKRKVESGKGKDLGDADFHSHSSSWLLNASAQEVRGGDPSGAMRHLPLCRGGFGMQIATGALRPGNDIYKDYRRSIV